MKPRLLDLCCCQGGAGKGYADAGFEVTGVDIVAQPKYPFAFVQADVLQVLADEAFVGQFQAVHISPPCQRYSLTQRIQRNEHPDLVGPCRGLLEQSGLPYVIENVEGAPLLDPVVLCGAMFGLRTYRHRLFETSFSVDAPVHPEHVAPLRKMGRPRQEGEFAHYVGNFSGVAQAREDMEMPWANRDGLREAIPPAYTRFIGKRLMEVL